MAINKHQVGILVGSIGVGVIMFAGSAAWSAPRKHALSADEQFESDLSAAESARHYNYEEQQRFIANIETKLTVAGHRRFTIAKMQVTYRNSSYTVCGLGFMGTDSQLFIYEKRTNRLSIPKDDSLAAAQWNAADCEGGGDLTVAFQQKINYRALQ